MQNGNLPTAENEICVLSKMSKRWRCRSQRIGEMVWVWRYDEAYRKQKINGMNRSKAAFDSSPAPCRWHMQKRRRRHAGSKRRRPAGRPVLVIDTQCLRDAIWCNVECTRGRKTSGHRLRVSCATAVSTSPAVRCNVNGIPAGALCVVTDAVAHVLVFVADVLLTALRQRENLIPKNTWFCSPVPMFLCTQTQQTVMLTFPAQNDRTTRWDARVSFAGRASVTVQTQYTRYAENHPSCRNRGRNAYDGRRIGRKSLSQVFARHGIYGRNVRRATQTRLAECGWRKVPKRRQFRVFNARDVLRRIPSRSPIDLPDVTSTQAAVRCSMF